MEKTRRATKTTRRQYEIYLDELRTNKPFRDNKIDGSDPQVIKRSWENLTNKLNTSGGPIKDVVEWKRVFTDWKSQVRSKARKLKALHLETDNIGTPQKLLTDIEETLLDLTGRVVVDGMDIPKIGIDPPDIQVPVKDATSSPMLHTRPEIVPSSSLSISASAISEDRSPEEKKAKSCWMP